MNVKPRGPQVFLKALLEPEKTKFGIVLPEESRDRTYRATVVYVGEGYLNPDGTTRPLDLKPGMEVLYARFAGTNLAVGGDTYIICHERDVHAILEEDE